MTFGQLFIKANPDVKVVENGTCVWIFFDDANHDTFRKEWWNKEIPDNCGWINIKDKLPEDFTNTLVSHRSGVVIAWYNGRYWEKGASTKHRNIKTITHWMPLPGPPKEKT